MPDRPSDNHRSPSGSPRRRSAKPAWAGLSDEQLLDWRMCDLAVQIDGTLLEERIAQLHQELDQRGLRFHPHCWLAEEWFSPDGVPGIAIPFFLAHPRLSRLEQHQMLEVEGGSREWCLRILRHEAGHALDTAYRLHRRASWQQTFGRSTIPYPDHYQPKPSSRNFVVHLEQWYAQSHPSEDFAETFAVWLKPRSRWRAEYAEWPALRKLEYVEETMAALRGKRPVVTSREQVESISSIRKTLREYYAEKRARYGIGNATSYDRELLRLFANAREHGHRMSAALFLRRHRQQLRTVVAKWTGHYQYTIDQVLAEMIARCRELHLRLTRAESVTLREAEVMLTVQTMNLHLMRHKIAL